MMPVSFCRGLLGDLPWLRETIRKKYQLRIPRGDRNTEARVVLGTFFLGIALKDPNSPSFDEDLRKALMDCVGGKQVASYILV